MLGQAGRAVAEDRRDVLRPGPGKGLAGALDEVCVDVQRPHVPAGRDELSEECGVVARGRSGFEGLVAGLRAELLQLDGDDRGRGDAGEHIAELAVLDRCGVLGVGAFEADTGEEPVAFDGPEGLGDLGGTQVAALGEAVHERFAQGGGSGALGGQRLLHLGEARGGAGGATGGHGVFRSFEEGDRAAQPGCGGPLVSGDAGAVEGEDRVVGEYGPQAAGQQPVGDARRRDLRDGYRAARHDRTMRILVMGGTWFLGRAVVDDALRRGWRVTAFTRGRSGDPAAGVESVHGDRLAAQDLARLAEAGPWDAVVDTSASELAPRDVLAGARALEQVARRYVYVSTVSVYRGWPDEPLTEESGVLDGPADADAGYGAMPAGWTGPDLHYGRQKAGAERAVLSAFGSARTAVVRPGVILGPGEYVGRLPWWLSRAARGGRILAPGSPGKGIQPVDVRDVARFLLDQVAAPAGGTFNVTAPVGRDTMSDLLTACLDATGASGRLVWAPDELLLDQGVRQWTELPLWRTHPGVWQIDAAGAYAAGLTCRPLVETVTDTWRWLQSGGMPVEHPRWAQHGIDPAKEAKILTALG